MSYLVSSAEILNLGKSLYPCRNGGLEAALMPFSALSLLLGVINLQPVSAGDYPNYRNSQMLSKAFTTSSSFPHLQSIKCTIWDYTLLT